MEHEHEFMVVDGILRCRTCGQIGGMKMEVLARTVSLRAARKIQDELATGWDVIGTNEYAVIYGRNKDGIEEELYIENKGGRKWRVVRTIKQEVGMG